MKKLNSKLVLISAALLAVVLGGAQCNMDVKFLHPPIEEAQEVQTIIFTEDEEFSPSAVRVPVGATVTWINESKVFFDFHPGNSMTAPPYTEFDAPLLAPGEGFSYTFTEAGTYYFHHGYEVPGVVYVEEKE